MNDRPGYFWCPDCDDWIPDQFVDHRDRHRAEARLTPAFGPTAIWVAAVTGGIIGFALGLLAAPH